MGADGYILKPDCATYITLYCYICNKKLPWEILPIYW